MTPRWSLGLCAFFLLGGYLGFILSALGTGASVLTFIWLFIVLAVAFETGIVIRAMRVGSREVDDELHNGHR